MLQNDATVTSEEASFPAPSASEAVRRLPFPGREKLAKAELQVGH